MAGETIHFDPVKVIVGGIRNDADPTTYDEEPCALRLNSTGALVVSIGGGTGAVSVEGPDAEDANITGNPLLAGGRYDTTARDLDNTDVGAIALDVNANQQVVGSVAHDAVDSGAPVLQGFHARDTLPTAVAEDDRVRGIADLYGRQYIHSASHDPLSVTDGVSVSNGPETQFEGGTLVSVNPGEDATYYYYIDMSGFSKLGLQLQLSGGSGTCTVTIEGTLQDDGTAAASCTYQDISSATFGAASWTANSILVDDAGKCGLYHFISVKVVASTGDADDATWTIYYKKMY